MIILYLWICALNKCKDKTGADTHTNTPVNTILWFLLNQPLNNWIKAAGMWQKLFRNLPSASAPTRLNLVWFFTLSAAALFKPSFFTVSLSFLLQKTQTVIERVAALRSGQQRKAEVLLAGRCRWSPKQTGQKKSEEGDGSCRWRSSEPCTRRAGSHSDVKPDYPEPLCDDVTCGLGSNWVSRRFKLCTTVSSTRGVFSCPELLVTQLCEYKALLVSSSSAGPHRDQV